jgi:microcystin-dependent protein
MDINYYQNHILLFMNKFGQLVGRPQRNVPLSTSGLEFVQGQTLLTAELARMAGGDYILSGCEVNGSNVSPGVMILDGEVIPFVGGTLETKVRVTESKSSVTAGSETYEDFYIRRHAEFGSNVSNVDTFLWSNINPLPTLKELATDYATKTALEELRDLVMPKGGIIMWSGSVETLPSGFALCNGQTVNEVKTPDLRGRFVVGYDVAKVNSPANATDLTENYGKVGNTGGSTSVRLTTTQIPDIKLTLPGQVGGDNNDMNNRTAFAGGDKSPAETAFNFDLDVQYRRNKSNTEYGQAHENRPPYFVLAFIIKVV